MKNITIYIASLVLVLITGRCKEINPFEGVSLVVSEREVSAPVFFQFTDANPESTTMPEGLTVKITSDKAAYILNNAGGKDYKVTGNTLILKLAKELVPTQSAPVKFTVEATAPGYLTARETYTLMSPGPARIVIPMVNIKEPPQGIITAEASVPVSGGKISLLNGSPARGARWYDSNLTRADAERGSVAFKPGTQVMDANGNIITTSQVSAQIGIYESSEPYGVDALLKSGKMYDIIRFIPAGAISIEMRAQGKEVKKISKPLEVTMMVSPDLRDPLTGEAVKEGSTIPIWSWEPYPSSKWKEEGVAVVSKNSQGDWIARFEISHLGYWQCSYYIPYDERCELNVALRVKSNSLFNTGNYDAELYDSKGLISRSRNFEISDGVHNYIDAWTPPGEKIKVVIKDLKSGKPVGEATFDACTKITSNKPHEINITIPDPIKPLYVNFDMTAICKNKNLKLKPNVDITVQHTEGQRWIHWTGFSLFNGKFDSLAVMEGKDYNVTVYADGKYYLGKFNFKRNGLTQVTTPEEGADFSSLKASAKYDAARDLIIYTAEYTIANCK